MRLLHIAHRERSCPIRQDHDLSYEPITHLPRCFLVKDTIIPNFFQHCLKIYSWHSAGCLAERHDFKDGHPALGHLDLLPALNPGFNPGKFMFQITNRCRFHVIQYMWHMGFFKRRLNFAVNVWLAFNPVNLVNSRRRNGRPISAAALSNGQDGVSYA